MKRATVADGENRSVELEVADVLLQLQHKDDQSTDAPTDQGPQGGRVVDHIDHSFVPTATPLHRAATGSTSWSPSPRLARSDDHTTLHLASTTTSTTTTTTPSAAYSFEPGQMQQQQQHTSTTSSVPRRLGIDFLLNHPPAPSSPSSSCASPPSPSSSGSSFDRHASWPSRPYIIEEQTTTSQGGATREADLQKLQVVGRYLPKSDRDYIVIEEEEEEDQNDYALRSPLEEGETATQTDRCLSSSDEDYDQAGSGSPPAVLVGYGLASVATTTTSPRRRPQRVLARAPRPPLGGDDRRPPPDSAARKCLNEKLRQRLAEKRRLSATQATKATSSPPPSADQEAHYGVGRRSTRKAGDEEDKVGSRGASRVGANLSTPGGRRGVATKKELDIWERLMLTSVIQPLLPSSSHSHSHSHSHPRSHSPPTLSSSLPSTSSSSSSSSSSRQARHQQQPEAPVTCMCAFGPPPGLAAYPYIGHGYNHSHSSALPHWGGPPPLAEELHQSADLFLDDDDDNVNWYRAAEDRKRKREQKSESDDEGGYYCGAYPRHLARSVPAYQSQAYDHHRQSRRPRLDPTEHQTSGRRDLSSPRPPRDSSALVFHHHTGAPVLDARTRPGGTLSSHSHSRSLVDVDLRGH